MGRLLLLESKTNRRKRRKIKVRMVGGPANGETVTIDSELECVQWNDAPTVSVTAFTNDDLDPAFIRGKIHNYWRRDFTYQLNNNRTRFWRIMVYEPDLIELMYDVDDLVCKAFDTFFGPSISEE
jgi:hypothetical protein